MHLRLFILLAGLSLVACQEDGKNGMQTTALGNRYTYVTSNEDGRLAEPGEYIYFNAQLRTEGDSVIFDTRDNPDGMPFVQALADSLVGQQTGPVDDIVRKLRVGERAVIRADISEYPPQAKFPGMENDTVALFDVEVMEVIDVAEFTERQEAMRLEQEQKAALVRERQAEVEEFTQQVYDDFKAGNLDGQLQSTPSGVQYIVHEEGSGPEAEPNRGVVVQYIGRLTSNGEIFDQSFEGGMGLPFVIGSRRVIPGWEEGIDQLQEGDKATLIIPSELAYGSQGTGGGAIPPDSELMFYVEVEKVQ